MISTTYINQIPQLQQVQYDTSSQLYYTNLALKALGLGQIKCPQPKYTTDTKIEALILSLNCDPNIINRVSDEEKEHAAYAVAVRLGLYDAANAIRGI